MNKHLFHLKKTYLLLSFAFLTIIIQAQSHWESVVKAEDQWKYLGATSEPASNWNTGTFDDSSWFTGTGGFGYGDSDDNTVISDINSIYLRKRITISNLSVFEDLILDIDYDDGFVCYLNNVEVARSSNLTSTVPTYNSSLTTDHEAVLYQGLTPERFLIGTNQLVEGENILAIQVINVSLTSSDMTARVYLNAKINSSETVYNTVPDWFEEPIDMESSNLPILFIDTEGQTIVDEPKIMAKMRILNNDGGINHVTDTVYEYDGYIGIEIRGYSSQSFAKKSFSVETRDSAGENRNFPVLGLPEENDWVLYGPYPDKSMIRNVFAYRLGEMLGRWAPRTKYCELYINDDYRGVYVLTEKIKRDKNRVDIAKLNEDEISGDDLTGGYILKVGRPEDGAWISPYKGRAGIRDVYISYIDPKYEEMPQEQLTYIKDYVTDFENALHGENFKDPDVGYRAYINTDVFAEYFLHSELSRNLDAYRVSTYMYKDKDSKGGKLEMGPFWDYNLAYGNGNFFAVQYPDGWVVDGVGAADAYEIPFWWDRFREDPYFESKIKIHWDKLRESVITETMVNNIIDSCANLLAEAQQRNFLRWDILGTYLWPNPYVWDTYEEEVDYLKSWISDRITWMDNEIALIEVIDEALEEEEEEEPVSLKTKEINRVNVSVYPNPFTESVLLRFTAYINKDAEVVLNDLLGKELFRQTINCNIGVNEVFLNSDIFNNEGIFIYKIIIDHKIVASDKLIKM